MTYFAGSRFSFAPSRRRVATSAILLLMGSALGGAASHDPEPGCGTGASALRVSDLQYVTSHNAFHIAPEQAIFDAVARKRTAQGIDAKAIAREIDAADYTHPTLSNQLDMGIRSLEIDLHDDPVGGRFTSPRILSGMAAKTVERLQSFDPHGDLSKPGFKTFHETEYDMRSRCLLFADCLRDIARWHRANPRHLPIFILLELKVDAEPLSRAAGQDIVWRRLQDAINAHFAAAELILPQNPARWPMLADARGKVAFLLFNYGDRPAERYAAYIASSGSPVMLHIEQDLHGLRASWQSRNDPATIAADVVKGRKAPVPGLLLYTKADTTGVQSLARRETALDSKANFIATDFEKPRRPHSSYAVSFEGRYVRTICPVAAD